MLFNFFFFVIDAQDKNAKEFIRRIVFQASQKIVSKSEAYISRLRVVLLTSIGLALKIFPRIKTLAFLLGASMTKKKSFIVLTT
jgi:hypothetical protein